MVASSWIAQKWSKQTFMFYNTCHLHFCWLPNFVSFQISNWASILSKWSGHKHPIGYAPCHQMKRPQLSSFVQNIFKLIEFWFGTTMIYTSKATKLTWKF
jgi:hypothetical protein